MVRQCPCKGRRCVCTLDGDGGIYLTGNGGARQPYIPRWALPGLVADDNSQADVTITGSGTSGDPWVVSIDTLGGSTSATIYNADDTWNKGGGTIAQVIVIGGGGGGGGVANANVDAGGSGGDGGAMSVAWFPIADLPDAVPIKVGQAGAGGRAVSGLTTGGDGGDSWFGEALFAPGGRGGHSQASPSQTQHTTLGGTPPDGGPGGAGAVRSGSTVIDATLHNTFLSPTGGGMGEGSVVLSSAGGDLTTFSNSWAGEGGDGGFDSTGEREGHPGDLYGGGGGGGMSDTDTGYAGSEGAPGVVVVTVW